MEFFTLLERDTIEELRRDFMQAEAGKNEGIDIYSFVRTLLKYWPTDNLEKFIGKTRRCPLTRLGASLLVLSIQQT
jgi:hypothetical protein